MLLSLLHALILKFIAKNFNEYHWCQTLGVMRFIVIRNSSDILERISQEVGAVYVFSAKPYTVAVSSVVHYNVTTRM